MTHKTKVVRSKLEQKKSRLMVQCVAIRLGLVRFCGDDRSDERVRIQYVIHHHCARHNYVDKYLYNWITFSIRLSTHPIEFRRRMINNDDVRRIQDSIISIRNFCFFFIGQQQFQTIAANTYEVPNVVKFASMNHFQINHDNNWIHVFVQLLFDNCLVQLLLFFSPSLFILIRT